LWRPLAAQREREREDREERTEEREEIGERRERGKRREKRKGERRGETRERRESNRDVSQHLSVVLALSSSSPHLQPLDDAGLVVDQFDCGSKQVNADRPLGSVQ
jgi:hypothetical protein